VEEGSIAAPSEAPRVARTSATAITSLVGGILGFVCLPVIGPLVAIFCALIAFADIHVSHGRVGGKGVAVAGMILGVLGLLLNIAMGVFMFFMFRYAMKMAEATVKFQKAAKALQDGDLDGAVDLVAGPTSPPKAELRARIRKAAAELGAISRTELARTDSAWTTGLGNVKMALTWNLHGADGEGHMTLDLRFDGSEWHVRDLQFGPGALPVRAR
jgi:hypothetical protein